MMTVMTVMIKVIMMVAPNMSESNFHSEALSVEKKVFFAVFWLGVPDLRTYGPTDGQTLL